MISCDIDNFKNHFSKAGHNSVFVATFTCRYQQGIKWFSWTLWQDLCHRVRRFWTLKFEIRRTSRKNQNSLKFVFKFDHEIYGSVGMSRWQVNSLMFRLGFGHKNCESAGRQWRRVVLCLDGASLCICRQNIPRASTVPTLKLCHCADMCGRVFPLGAAIVQTGEMGLPTWSSHCDWADLDNL